MALFLNPMFIPFFLIPGNTGSVKNYTKSNLNHGSDSSLTKPTSRLSISRLYSASPNAKMGYHQQSCNDKIIGPLFSLNTNEDESLGHSLAL